MEWKRFYSGEEGEPKVREICSDSEAYTIAFINEREKYECRVLARNADEALGVFFQHHRDVCFKDVRAIFVDTED